MFLLIIFIIGDYFLIKSSLIVFSSLFIALFWLAYLNNEVEMYLPIYVSLISCITFVYYTWDKRKAVQSNHKKVSRIPERHLHLLALFGGWPGALIAQQSLRHKSQKRVFIAVLWVCIVVNICFLGYFWMSIC